MAEVKFQHLQDVNGFPCICCSCPIEHSPELSCPVHLGHTYLCKEVRDRITKERDSCIELLRWEANERKTDAELGCYSDDLRREMLVAARALFSAADMFEAKWLQPYTFIWELHRLIIVGKKEQTLDYIFNTFDNLHSYGEFKTSNKILEILMHEDYKPWVWIGILTITLAAKNELLNRAELFQKIQQSLIIREGEERAARLLRGLE